jgi:hypothetical protein
MQTTRVAMAKKIDLTRRDLMVGTGATFVTLSLGDFLFPSEARALTPKKGGKLVYAITSL